MESPSSALPGLGHYGFASLDDPLARATSLHAEVPHNFVMPKGNLPFNPFKVATYADSLAAFKIDTTVRNNIGSGRYNVKVIRHESPFVFGQGYDVGSTTPADAPGIGSEERFDGPTSDQDLQVALALALLA